jgi:hypothetical protein
MKAFYSVVVLAFALMSLVPLDANPRAGHQEGVQLLDIGVIGLTSHDLISWDREKLELRNSKDRLDLGTVYDWLDETTGENRWRKGGDPKNSENAPVFSVVQQLLGVHSTNYDYALSLGSSEEDAFKQARIETIRHYHKMVKVSFERLFGIPLPQPDTVCEGVTATEHAAMRAAHHILPGKMWVSFGPMKREIELTNFMYAQLNLSPEDLSQPVRKFNGRYDREYTEFTIPFGPRKGERQNLYEIDKSFVENFTDYRFDDMLQELAQQGSFEGVSFQAEIEQIYAKGFCSDNSWVASALEKK